MSALCDAHRGEFELHPTVHTCDDPLACALGSLAAEDDPTEAELARLDELINQVRHLLSEARPSKLRDALMEVLL